MNDPGIALKVPTNAPAVRPWPIDVRVALYLVLFAITYYVGAQFGFGFRFQHSLIGVVWPASGLMVSALLLSPRKYWWVVVASAAVAHVAAVGGTMPAWRVLWQIGGTFACALATVEVLGRVGLPLHLGSRRQAVLFLATCFAVPTVFAFITPSFIRSSLGFQEPYPPVTAIVRTTLSIGTALLLTTPVVVLWAEHGIPRLRQLSGRRLVEAVLLMVAALSIGFVAFASSTALARYPLLPLCVFVPLLWAAVRFGPLGASTALFCVAAVSLWGTARQLGPFVLAVKTDQVLSLQLFWIVLSAPVMILAAVIREHEQIAAALTEQRRQLAHVTRAATISELSGALVHELSQPLTAILANARAGVHLLARQPAQLQELREIFEDITREDKHAAGVISRLRLFLKERELHFGPVAIDTVVRDALTLAHSAITFAGVRLQAQFDTGLPRVSGDPVQLTQVVLNLIVNGCEAMNQLPTRERKLSLRVAHADADHVHIVVSDNGVGLPTSSEERVFDPFFTTKEKGLGLGLTISQSIVTSHRGQLWGENNPDRGAAFHLLLPAEAVSRAGRGYHRGGSRPLTA
jgi:signal transduction histidine kinase